MRTFSLSLSLDSHCLPSPGRCLLILERALVYGRDLLVRLYFRAIYYLGGMVLPFVSLFYDFVVDCILHSSLFIILNLSKGNFGATIRSSLPHMSNFSKVVWVELLWWCFYAFMKFMLLSNYFWRDTEGVTVSAGMPAPEDIQEAWLCCPAFWHAGAGRDTEGLTTLSGLPQLGACFCGVSIESVIHSLISRIFCFFTLTKCNLSTNKVRDSILFYSRGTAWCMVNSGCLKWHFLIGW